MEILTGIGVPYGIGIIRAVLREPLEELWTLVFQI
jgi:hypothetical protein